MTAQSASAKEIHVFFSPRITRMTRILHSSLFMSEDKNWRNEMMPVASDNGSQPYSRAYGYGEPTVTVRACEGK